MDIGSSVRTVRVAVVGAGNVGSTFAYALLLSGLSSEIVLVDANRDKAEGEAMDLSHTVPFTHPTRVWAGDYRDCAGAAVTVLAAGLARLADSTRLQLADRNVEIFGEIVPQVARYNPGGVIIVATNPVDVLTYVALKRSGLPPERVLGTGTILDTARFRYLLSQHFQVDARSIEAYVIGEHGDSELPVWSLANIAGMRLSDYCAVHGIAHDQHVLDEMFTQTRNAAANIIRKKGATYYAVAAGMVRIVEAILRDQHSVLSVSSLVRDYYGISDVCFSLPSVVACNGIERVIRLDLNEAEIAGIRRSAEVLEQAIAALKI
jgi:L-lactate dehydrogenase